MKFTEAGVCFVSETEELEIPERLLGRCGLLQDIRDQADVSEQEIPIQVSMADAKAWLVCAKVDDGDTIVVTTETQVGALKVRVTAPHRYSPIRSIIA